MIHSMNKKMILVTAFAIVVGITTGFGIGTAQRTPVQAETPTVQGGCPAPTSKGAYNQLGTDPATGKSICHFVFSNACPYTEAVSADDPMCYKNQPVQTPPITPTTGTTTNVPVTAPTKKATCTN